MNLSVFSANIFDDSKTNEQNTSDSEKISEMTIIFEYKHLALNTQNALFAKKTSKEVNSTIARMSLNLPKFLI